MAPLSPGPKLTTHFLLVAGVGQGRFLADIVIALEDGILPPQNRRGGALAWPRRGLATSCAHACMEGKLTLPLASNFRHVTEGVRRWGGADTIIPSNRRSRGSYACAIPSASVGFGDKFQGGERAPHGMLRRDQELDARTTCLSLLFCDLNLYEVLWHPGSACS